MFPLPARGITCALQKASAVRRRDILSYRHPQPLHARRSPALRGAFCLCVFSAGRASENEPASEFRALRLARGAGWSARRCWPSLCGFAWRPGLPLWVRSWLPGRKADRSGAGGADLEAGSNSGSWSWSVESDLTRSALSFTHGNTEAWQLGPGYVASWWSPEPSSFPTTRVSDRHLGWSLLWSRHTLDSREAAGAGGKAPGAGRKEVPPQAGTRGNFVRLRAPSSPGRSAGSLAGSASQFAGVAPCAPLCLCRS